MVLMKFEVIDIIEGDIFPFVIRAYERFVDGKWEPCSIEEQVSHKWFGHKKFWKVDDDTTK